MAVEGFGSGVARVADMLDQVVVEPAPADRILATEAYASRFSGPVGAWMLGRQRRAVSAMLRRSGAKTVLDVGGGHGQNLPVYRDLNLDATVAVSDAAAGAYLRRNFGCGTPVRVTDLVRLDLPDRTVDAAVSLRMLAHVEDWEDYIAELCRVADRTVIVDFARRAGFNRLSGALFEMKANVEIGTRRFAMHSRDEIAASFEKHGFRVSAHVGQFVLPMALHRLLRRRPLSQALEWLLSPLASAIGNPVILQADRIESARCRQPVASPSRGAVPPA